MKPEAEHGSQPALPAFCAGLRSDIRWDEPDALKGELYHEEHLVTHALELARAHGKPTLARTPGPLRKRFARARERITEAYQILAKDAQIGREPSPAEEWLLDNSNVVRDQIREIAEDLPFGYLIELPRLAAGEMRGYPRVYGLCLDYLRHTDARIDATNLAKFVTSYQSVERLTIGELWAVPIMLRLGLILTVGALAASEAGTKDRERGDAWADKLLANGASSAETGARLLELERSQKPISPAFLVQLLRRLRDHEGSLDMVREWAVARCAAMGTTPEDLVRREHLRQAADQVSVGNAITSMRAVGAVDWDEFFERTSEVESVLRRDPAGAYTQSDVSTRDRYRHVIEDLARRGKLDEVGVANAVLRLATPVVGAVAGAGPSTHVGYYLVDRGRDELERQVGYRPRLQTRIVRKIVGNPSAAYFMPFGLFTAALVLAAAHTWAEVLELDIWFWLLAAALALPASEIALGLVNCLVVSVLPPRLLAKLDFERGIPAEHRTLVVVPVLVDHPAGIDQLIEDLEVRSLANTDPNLYFALLTDFADSPTETAPDDAALLEHTQAGLARLNRERGQGEDRYFLFHRRRVYAESEGRYMGAERKRGKLEELNRLLLGDQATTFSLVTAPQELLRTFRYVITLDADTDLPRGVGRKLVATLAHPLNRAVVDPRTARVVRGYGIVQPRVGTLPMSSRQSRFAAILTGPSGIDPYTTAVSDTYQDLFGEGSYVGKGIYDIAAFHQATQGRVPAGQLLSHDLFEGIFARAALATDIEVLDDQPASYEVQVGRQHRWVRGDWQLLPWLLPRVPDASKGRANELRAIDAWKMVDNLRRSLLAPGLIALSVASWFLHERVMGAVLSIFVAVFIVPLCARLLLSVVRQSSAPTRSFTGSLGGDLRSNAPQVLLQLVFVLDQAWVSVDAISRSLYRQLISRKNLLEWTTMRQAQVRARSRVNRRLWLESGACLALLVLVLFEAPQALPFAVPILLLWALAPVVASWLATPPPRPEPSARVAPSDRELLSLTAQKTWRFFEEFVTEADNFLPPDNFQEEPRGVVAHRTSPTNIGLYLLSVVSARDLFFITLGNTIQRLHQTLTTLEELEKREGHILNWYDTTTLRPLEPQYVSTVDSGNLAAYLWTLREACADLSRAQIGDLRVIAAASDALRLAHAQLSEASPEAARDADLRRLVEEIGDVQRTAERGEHTLFGALGAAARAVAAYRSSHEGDEPQSEATYWVSRAELLLARSIDELSTLTPCVDRLPEALDSLPSELVRERARALLECLSPRGPLEVIERGAKAMALVQEIRAGLSDSSVGQAEAVRAAHRELDDLELVIERSVKRCQDAVSALHDIGQRAEALALGMNFRFLFDEQRELFAIGYNVSSARLDTSHYDLLASEARLASLFCIAKGDVAERHWFRLGRPRARTAEGRALCSWSGSMFEYLMPLLVTRTNPDTLLAEGYEVAIERQRQYGVKRGVPWGVSESAYNVMDLRMTYQYRAFGVPGLGLKAGLGEDLVVAPYATVLAGLVRPDLISRNLRALVKEGLDGPYGFYESIDYTPEHVPPGRRGVVVKAFMAHHQGMTLVALDNILNDGVMQQRFHRDPRVKATELLLEERVPPHAPETVSTAAVIPGAVRVEPRVEVAEQVGLRGAGPLRVHLLGHGELSLLATATGAGVTTWKGLDVNRFREEPLLEAGGIYLYVRNRSEGKVWSAGYQPTRAEPSFYNVAFSIDRVEFHRRDRDVQTVTEVTVSPEHAVELRRVTLSNQAAKPLDLEITSYTELVLAARTADVAHRAFGNLFVETEALPERGALLAKRRPRLAGEPEVWVFQLLVPETDGWGAFDFDTSRESFLGRGRSVEAPLAMLRDASLARRTGLVLDPALALRRSIRLAPTASARLTLITGLASTREEALALIETHSTQQSILRAIELGWAGVRVELRHLGISAPEVHRFQRLLSAVIFPHPALRAMMPASGTTRGRHGLWAQGISGDLPIVLCRIDNADFAELCRDLVLAHEFWRLNGFTSDLVFINEEPSGYLQPTQDTVRELIRNAAIDQRGGVFLRRADQMSEEERELIASAARVVLTASHGSLTRQLRRAATARPLPDTLSVTREARLDPLTTLPPARPELRFDNGFGGFTEGGRKYVIVLSNGERTPAPWCNVMANPHFGSMVSEVGSSFTWAQNSQRHRLTPWSNDASSDPSGELFYLRDERDGSSWSLTPAPAGEGAQFHVSHGQGTSEFVHERRALQHTLTMSVSPSDPVKCVRLRLRNLGKTARKLSLYGFVEWVMGSSRETSRVSTSTSYDAELRSVFAANPLCVFPTHRAFFCASERVDSFTADREEFFGPSGSAKAPEALSRTRLSGAAGAGLDPCAALQLTLNIGPGASVEVGFALGQGETLHAARSLAARYSTLREINAAIEGAEHAWDELLETIQVKTPDPALDILANRWLLYQSASSRLWGRTGFYQSSGAFGYRDQLQDVLALLHTRPSVAREHLLRCAARQFAEGDVQHWWHAETGEGLRTRCSDDMLWLPYVTAEYVRVTADRGILDESVPFLNERVLGPEEEDLFSSPAVTEQGATLYEHCTRALDIGTTSGPHGLPTMRGGDWNDGMNRVGHRGQGESVWLAWFIARTLQDFSAIAQVRGDRERVNWCAREVGRITRATEQHAWDGAWYRRAYFDDGSALGSKQNAECSIDAIAQSWAVISGIADRERAARAVRASEELLINRRERLMSLLTPPFQHTVPDPGYIQAYPPGIRENGGQYTHGVLWTVVALTSLGEGERAHALLALLNPVGHADRLEAAQRYRVEPYVVAADVYSSDEHMGRGGWTWYTGSAGWFYRVIIENVLGLRRRGLTLDISPCIPAKWPGFELVYRAGTSQYHITVDNSANVSSGVASVEVDGRLMPDGKIRLVDDGQLHEVRITLGQVEQARTRSDRGMGRLGT